MNNRHDMSFKLILSDSFYTEAISAAHRYVDPPNTYLRYANEHHHDRIVCVISGMCVFDIFNDNPIVAGPGDVVYIPYNIAYRTEWQGKERGEIYSLNYTMYSTDGQQMTMYPEIHLFANCDRWITESLFRECYMNFTRKEYGYVLQCKYLFLKILHLLVVSENELSNSRIRKAVQFMETNYLLEFSVSDLATMCNLGECMFRRCFKAEFGMSPLKYRNKLRIDKAYEMLVSENLNVTEVMELTGFYDLSYFNKVFKSYIGKSPSECRVKRN